MKLLEDILVLDFSQFLSAPSASLRLADMGARVIKVERPDTGDICRSLYVSDVEVHGESTIFHAINRNKESFAADLKKPEDRAKLNKLIARADVMLHNFRPGVMERLGLDYQQVKELNPTIIYGSISGYGEVGEWREMPGQDLLLQAVSGITYLSGSADDPPIPMGVAVGDIVAGTHLAQGILSALYRRLVTGQGAHIQISMLESLLDFQFEVITTYLNDGFQLPKRSSVNGAHAYIAAPYGIYKTHDGYMALAMGNIPRLGELLDSPPLQRYRDERSWFDQRDEIKHILKELLVTKPTAEWLARLEPADIWCADVLDYEKLRREEGYRVLQMEQQVHNEAFELTTTRCPIRVDGVILKSETAAPHLGEHNEEIENEFGL
ncbi:CaiB/BaiF CoA transferase family protein [Parapedobacter indicus]|uniref:Crotonobetainyl-CoA:carnitine CoA-transferase CaiB n=1 Tax=Parapedobacter indicus TaxID=1477437 RepID=A0A1I3S039_9SPHI|nr:CoA transferase [Parapedobacter indicus]PPK99924.1 crotonobetainyl-CoA:carnitine CoA-transferase CaiB-like acyl-CoA transferase [Parapedobacter indicus]SFJ51680.1 Crotonobetainyl-CoA:carnitine CoA-transferase CaiB [Parapedobacter indicus]